MEYEVGVLEAGISGGPCCTNSFYSRFLVYPRLGKEAMLRG
jgi:hypothetical protein